MEVHKRDFDNLIEQIKKGLTKHQENKIELQDQVLLVIKKPNEDDKLQEYKKISMMLRIFSLLFSHLMRY